MTAALSLYACALLAWTAEAGASFVPSFSGPLKGLLKSTGDSSLSVVTCVGTACPSKSSLLTSIFDAPAGKTALVLDKNVALVNTDGMVYTGEGEWAAGPSQDASAAAALADVIIVNVMFHDVFERKGAGIAELVPVFESMLKLDQVPAKKKVILVAVRDYEPEEIGKEKLGELLRGKFDGVWQQLQKPEDKEDSKFADLFDLQLHFMPHAVFAEQAFNQEVRVLKSKFLQRNFGSAPAPEILRSLDSMSKDGPEAQGALPGEVEASYHCCELAEDIYASTLEKSAGMKANTDAGKFMPDFGTKAYEVLMGALDEFDAEAAMFSTTNTFALKREALRRKVLADLKVLHSRQLKRASAMAIEKYNKALSTLEVTPDVADSIKSARKEADSSFTSMAQELNCPGARWQYCEERKTLQEELKESGEKNLQNLQMQGAYMPNTSRKPVELAVHVLHPHPFGKDSRLDNLSQQDPVRYRPSAGQMMTASGRGEDASGMKPLDLKPKDINPEDWVFSDKK